MAMDCCHPSEQLTALKAMGNLHSAIYCGRCQRYVRPEELVVHIELADPYSMSIEIEDQSPFIEADIGGSEQQLSNLLTAFEADSWQTEEGYFGDI